jgi:hypothetical protein
MFQLIGALIFCFLVSIHAVAEIGEEQALGNIVRVGLLHGDPEPFRLPLAVLEKAFQRLTPPAKLELVDISYMNQKRALESMIVGDAQFDVFFSGFSQEREKNLLQIDVPLTMGLLGSRVLVVNENRHDNLLQEFRTAANIKRLAVGSGIQWPDTDILIHNQFNVVQASYQGLWKMLSSNRIDAFARGIEEAFVEIEQRRNNNPPPMILDKWLLVYPLDYFVYLNPSKKKLHRQLNQALQQAHSSGEIAAVIASEPSAKKALYWLRNKEYSKIYLDNPLLSERVRQLPKEYWLPEIRK